MIHLYSLFGGRKNDKHRSDSVVTYCICDKRITESVCDSVFEKTEDWKYREGRRGTVPPEKSGDTDHGRSDHSDQCADYLFIICGKISEDHTDPVPDTWIWNYRFSG